MKVRIFAALLLLMSCAGAGVTPPASAPAATQPIAIRWLGHAAFEVVSSGGTKLLIDPFLTENPATPAAWKDLSRYDPDFILVTHTTVRVVPAMHGSEPSGRPVGYVIEFADGRSVYHQGDTWVFGDMAIIEELYHPTIILMNTGGRAYGQSPQVALWGVKRYFHPRIIIPMHFASMPSMSTEAEVRAAIGSDPRVRFLQIGEATNF